MDERYLPRRLTEDLSEQEKANLIKVMEEAGELIQAAAKILMWGYESYHPLRPAVDNKHTFMHEWQDLLNAVQRLKL